MSHFFVINSRDWFDLPARSCSLLIHKLRKMEAPTLRGSFRRISDSLLRVEGLQQSSSVNMARVLGVWGFQEAPAESERSRIQNISSCYLSSGFTTERWPRSKDLCYIPSEKTDRVNYKPVPITLILQIYYRGINYKKFCLFFFTETKVISKQFLKQTLLRNYFRGY